MPPATDRRIPGLDGLRALAIAMVLVFHAEIAVRPSAESAAYGFFGVALFFVISGFLITHLLRRERLQFGAINLRRFYARRVLRIFPVFYGYILVTALLAAAGLISVPALQFLSAATFTRNFFGSSWYFAHFWSLSVEEQFYLLWPVLLCLVSESTAVTIAATVLLASPLWFVVIWHLGLHPFANWPVHEQFIAAGCVLALRRDRLHAHPWYRRLITPTGLAAVTLALIADVVWLSTGPYANGSHPARLGLLAGALLLVLFVDGCIVHSARGGPLSWRPLVWLGTLSYSLYIWQQLFMAPIAGLRPRFPEDILFSLAAVWGSYYGLERWFLRLKSRFRPAPSHPAIPARAGTS